MRFFTDRRIGPRALIIALAAVLVVLLVPLHAEAAFNKTVSASLSASSATLAAPTGTGTAKACVILALGGATMTATWTASASTYATGYTVTVLRNNVVDSINSVNGRATVTATYPIDYNVPYTFTIRAGYQSWTSVLVTAPAVTCTGLG